jgi:hypothetical protein
LVLLLFFKLAAVFLGVNHRGRLWFYQSSPCSDTRLNSTAFLLVPFVGVIFSHENEKKKNNPFGKWSHRSIGSVNDVNSSVPSGGLFLDDYVCLLNI